MNSKDQTTSKTQQSETERRSNMSSDMLTVIPIPSSAESYRGDHISELYGHSIIVCMNEEEQMIDVLDLETDKCMSVEFQEIEEYVSSRGFNHSACRKGMNEIVLYTGHVFGPCHDILVLTLKDDNEFARIKAFTPKNRIDFAAGYWLHFFNDKLYLLDGGSPGVMFFSAIKLYSFDFTSLAWSECKFTAKFSKNVCVLSSVLAYGKLYLFTCTIDTGEEDGLAEFYEYNEAGEGPSEFYELDLSSENLEWKQIVYTGSAPSPREKVCIVAEDGKIYVLGGKSLQKKDPYDELFEYDIDSKVWREIQIDCDLDFIAPCTGVFYKGTLFVTGRFVDKDGEGYQMAKIKFFDPTEKQFKHQLENLSVDPQSSDVLFKVHDQTFPAHKDVLSVRCQFFKNMFESGMIESNNSEIFLQDIEPSSFKAVLDYIYTNKVEFTVGLAGDLLKLSDKWSFTTLKTKCEEFLSKQLTPDNFKEIAVLLEHVEASKLENAIIDFAVKNVKATKDRKFISGLSKELYMNIIVNILNIKLKN